jgi:hypothetical protein
LFDVAAMAFCPEATALAVLTGPDVMVYGSVSQNSIF